MNPPRTQQSSRSPTRYKLAGLATGSDRRRTAGTSVKMATFAPMPSDRVKITVAADPGDLRELAEAKFEVVDVRTEEA